MTIFQFFGCFLFSFLSFMPCTGQTLSPLEAVPNPVMFDSTSSARFTLRTAPGQTEAKIDSLKFAFSQDEAITLGAEYNIYLSGVISEPGYYICTRDVCGYSGVDIRGKVLAASDSIAVEIWSYCGICKHQPVNLSVFSDTLLIYVQNSTPLRVGLENVTIATSVEETAEQFAPLILDVFPNPFESDIRFLIQSKYPESEIEVSIFDILGREILRRSIKSQGENSKILDLSLRTVTAGLYIARIKETRSGRHMGVVYRTLIKNE